ncbi:hypothetical protein D046_0973B, partial [Vibrio parahaemolyticus V-223/04]
KND